MSETADARNFNAVTNNASSYTATSILSEHNTSSAAKNETPITGLESLVDTEHVVEVERLDLASLPKKPGYQFVKRAFDIVFSSAVIVVGIVPSLLLSLAVAKDTGGSPVYSQERIGKDGKPFHLYKFRTMVADADNVEKYLNEEQLAQWYAERKVEDDPRITPLGRFLRKSSIDEFPQFINVFKGEMSTIGPRAITEDELEWFGEDINLVLSVRPGITGLWQTGPRNEATFEGGGRQLLELSYVYTASLKTDALIFFRTFKTMIAGTGK